MRESLCAVACGFSMRRGERVFASDIGESVLVVKSGVIAVSLQSEAGKSKSFFIAKPGSVFNLIRLAGTTEQYDVTFNSGHFGRALCDVEVCKIPIAIVKDAFFDDSEFAWMLFARMSDLHRDMIVEFADMVEKSGVERIASLLESLENAGLDSTLLTHEVIGDVLGMNRVSVSRLMADAVALMQHR